MADNNGMPFARSDSNEAVSYSCRFQLRCVMSQPLTVYPGAEVYGQLNLVAHARQSYDIISTLGVKSPNPQTADQQVDLAALWWAGLLEAHC